MFYKLLSSAIFLSHSLAIIWFLPGAVGPETYGEFSYLLAVSNLFYQFCLLNVNTSYIYFQSNSKINTSSLNLFYIFYICVCVFFVLFIFVVGHQFSWGLMGDIGQFSFIAIIFLYSTMNFLVQRTTDFADVCNKTRSAELIKSVWRFFFIILFIIYASYSSISVEFTTLLSSSISVLLIGSIVIGISRHVKFEKFSWKIIKKIFNYSAPLMVFSIISTFWMLTSRYILQKDGGSIETAFFSIAYSLAMMPVGVLSSLTSLFLKRLLEPAESTSGPKNWLTTVIQENCILMFSFIASSSVFLYLFADAILINIIGEEYLLASSVIKIMSLFCCLNFFGMMFSNLFFAQNKNHLYLKINSSISILSLIILFICTNMIEFNAITLSYFLLVTYFMRVIFQYFFIKEILKSLQLKKMLIIFTGILGFCLLTATLLLNIQFNFFITIIIYGLLNAVMILFLRFFELINFS